jgi:hypothetical protein
MSAFTRSSAGRWVLGALVLPALFFVAVVLFWQWNGSYPPSGDEPHYLLLARALGDGRLDLRPYYAAAATNMHSELHTVSRGGALYSHHGPGVALLIALPYRFGGVPGVRLALCCLAGFLTTAIYRIVRRTTGSPGWSAAGFVVVAAGLPFPMAAGQIYPDLLVGLILVNLLDLLHRGWDARGQWPSRIGYALGCGVLPWLHHRHFPVALLFLLAFIVRLRQSRNEAGPGAGSADRWGVFVPVGLSLLLQGAEWIYSYWLFGSWSGVGSPQLLGTYSLLILAGMHLDQFHGLFLQNPFLLLGLVGLIPFARHAPRFFVFWTTVYAAAALPIALSDAAGYGGSSFPGRYQWDFVTLWSLPLAHFLSWLLKSGGRRWLACLLIAGLGAQLGFSRAWLMGGVPLIDSLRWPAWAAGSFAPAWRWHLPWFENRLAMLHFWPNLSWTLFAFSLLALGVWISKPRRHPLRGFLLAAPSLLCIAVAQPPNARTLRALRYPGASLLGQTGQEEGSRRVARQGRDGPGALVYGPYLALPPGTYEVSLTYEAVATTVDRPATWDWTSHAGSRVLASGVLAEASQPSALQRELVVPPGPYLRQFEVRVWYAASGAVAVDSVTIKPRLAALQGASVP